MIYNVISNFDEALDFLIDKPEHFQLVKTWIPEAKFIELLHYENGISISREDEGIFSFALGSKAPLRDNWERISFERKSLWIANREFREQSDWEAHCLHHEGIAVSQLSEIRSDLEIGEFMRANAPELSVFPGNKEIVHWSTLVGEGDQLLGVAAICKWESGQHVIASVATDKNFRGQGLGSNLIAVIKNDLVNLGISEVCLGVQSNNEPAKRLYARTGFEKLFDFRSVKNFRN